MHAGEIVLTVDNPAATSERLARLQQRDRVFWAGLAAAFLAHVLLIVGIGSAREHTLGTPDGANDAIAVEIVDGATLKDSMEPPTPATPPPGAQPQQTAALPPAQPPPEPQAEPQPEEVVPPPPAPETAKPAETPPTEKPAPDLSAEAVPALDDATPADALHEPKPQEAPKQDVPKPEAEKQDTPETKKPPTKQQAKQQPKQQPRKQTQTSSLDLSVPYDGAATESDSGAGSAVQRPPGITRSGENDEFARNVIRALQKTMPRERARGRVTVRIVLNENGSRADVKLLQSGGDPDLDFNVMFAARQTAYPFPPMKSTLVDRTFTVTYIYR
jgi:TonB family protein